MPRDTRGKGFTLIELLVVVAIIALLISILLPSLQQAKEQAKKAKCLANMKGIATSVHAYATEDRSEHAIPIFQLMRAGLEQNAWDRAGRESGVIAAIGGG